MCKQLYQNDIKPSKLGKTNEKYVFQGSAIL